MAKTEAGAVDHDTKVNEAFERANEHGAPMDWPALEDSIRLVLRDYDQGRLSMLHALRFVDGYLGAYTLRGCELTGGECHGAVSETFMGNFGGRSFDEMATDEMRKDALMDVHGTRSGRLDSTKENTSAMAKNFEEHFGAKNT